MFDSDNISIVTRIESCDGVDVTYNKNSAGEGVWNVCINSTWLQSQIDARFTALNTAALNRISALESVTGVTGTTGGTSGSGSGGSGSGGSGTPAAGTNNISIALSSGSTNPGTEISIKWSIVNLDGRNILSRAMSQKLSAGAIVDHIADALASAIGGSEQAASYIASATAAGNIVTVTWLSAVGFSITAEVLAGNVTIAVA